MMNQSPYLPESLSLSPSFSAFPRARKTCLRALESGPGSAAAVVSVFVFANHQDRGSIGMKRIKDEIKMKQED
eukprot:1373093-Rhodomonas_salina.1